MMTTPPKRVTVILIGIAGPSCCGKSTYAQHLSDHLHSPLRVISLDDFYVRGIPINHPILGHVMNEELPETLDSVTLIRLLRTIQSDPTKETFYHRSTVDNNDQNPVIVVVEGFILFALSHELTKLFDIRLFFESDQNQCRLRRYRRHYKISPKIIDAEISIPNSFQQWFDHLVWAEYLKQRELQFSQVEKVFSSNEFHHYQYRQIDDYIDQRLKVVMEERRKNT